MTTDEIVTNSILEEDEKIFRENQRIYQASRIWKHMICNIGGNMEATPKFLIKCTIWLQNSVHTRFGSDES